MIQKYRFLADENIPLEVVFKLEEKGLDIKSMSFLNPGADDTIVLDIANREKRVLITFDKDFGELIFKRKLRSSGVILLRVHPSSVDTILYLLYKVFSRSVLIDFSIAFCVVEEKRLRVVYFFPPKYPKNL